MILTEEQKTLADAAFANKLNVIHHAYVDLCDDLVAGALLGQILYWFGADRNGHSRAKIEKNGYTWIAKTRTDWHDEIRISPKQYDRAIKILKTKNFVEVATFKFNGNPTTHIRIIPSSINSAIEAWKIEQVKWLFPDGEKPTRPRADGPFSPMVESVVPQRSITDFTDGDGRYSPTVNNEVTRRSLSSYTEITTENLAENTHREKEPAVPEVSEPISFQNHKETIQAIEESFAEVWEAYPKKEGKQKAKKAFERALRGMGTRRSDGEPYTAEEILTEVVLYRQHVERLMSDGELTYRYIPTGGSWFESEGWLNDYPSISSSFDDYGEGVDYNRNVMRLRATASKIGQAHDEIERYNLRLQLNRLIAALPY